MPPSGPTISWSQLGAEDLSESASFCLPSLNRQREGRPGQDAWVPPTPATSTKMTYAPKDHPRRARQGKGWQFFFSPLCDTEGRAESLPTLRWTKQPSCPTFRPSPHSPKPKPLFPALVSPTSESSLPCRNSDATLPKKTTRGNPGRMEGRGHRLNRKPISKGPGAVVQAYHP